MTLFKLVGFLLFTLVVKANTNSGVEIINVVLNNYASSTNQTARQEDLSFVATGSEVADSAIKITGFVFKFFTQTVSSIFGKQGLRGAAQTAFNLDSDGHRVTANKGKCEVSSSKRPPPKQQQQLSPKTTPKTIEDDEKDVRSGETVDDYTPAKAVIYNLMSNHDYVAQLLKNVEDEKLLGVVAIVSKNRVIPLVVNAIDLKSFRLENSSDPFNIDSVQEDLAPDVSNRQLEEVVLDSPVAETTLAVTKYVFHYLTQTVISVFGTGLPSNTPEGQNQTTGSNKNNSASCVPQKGLPRSGNNENSPKPSIPDLRIKDDNLNMIFNITNDDDQKILGIVAIISKNGVFPLLVNVVDLERVEDNPLSNVFRNWDQILNKADKISSADGSKKEIEVEIVKEIQALRKAHPWLLPKVF